MAHLVQRLKSVPEKDKPSNDEFAAQIEREQLIEHLGPPQMPESTSFLFWGLVILIPALGPLLILMSPLRPAVKSFMAGFVATFFAALGLHLFNQDFEKSGAFYFIGLSMILVYWIGLWYSKGAFQAEYETKRLPGYQRALPRWSRLCYCSHCKRVYLDDANDRRTAAVAEAQSFLAS